MADNIAVTAGSGTTIAADDVGAGVLHQRVKVTWGPDGTGNDTDTASGKALPVQLRSGTGVLGVIDSHGSVQNTLVDSSGNAITFNANGYALPANSAPVAAVSGGVEWETVAASQTDQILGATGGQGDYLEGLVCVVATAATSQVQIKDANGSAITVLPNAVGAGVGTYYVPLGLVSLGATTPGWKVTTAAGVSVIGIGNFT